jgi:hypothetical protein
LCCSILRKLTDKRVHCLGVLPANSTAVAGDRRDSALRVLLEVRNYEHDKEELENLRQKFKSRTIIDMDFQIVPASYGSYCFEEETEDWGVDKWKAFVEYAQDIFNSNGDAVSDYWDVIAEMIPEFEEEYNVDAAQDLEGESCVVICLC